MIFYMYAFKRFLQILQVLSLLLYGPSAKNRAIVAGLIKKIFPNPVTVMIPLVLSRRNIITFERLKFPNGIQL